MTGSEVVTADLWVTFGLPPGLSGETVSIAWDDNALKLQSCAMAGTNALPAQSLNPGGFGPAYVAGGSFAPLLGPKANCPAPAPGLQPSVDQQAGYLPYIAGGGTFLAARLVFHVTGAVGGNTVVTTFFNPATDGWGDGSYQFSQIANHAAATVHVIPEPTTVLLVGAGFLGLLAAGRRRRS
jgi:hypothetical protein